MLVHAIGFQEKGRANLIVSKNPGRDGAQIEKKTKCLHSAGAGGGNWLRGGWLFLPRLRRNIYTQWRILSNNKMRYIGRIL